MTADPGNVAFVIGSTAIGLGIAVTTLLGLRCAMLPGLFGNRHPDAVRSPPPKEQCADMNRFHLRAA